MIAASKSDAVRQQAAFVRHVEDALNDGRIICDRCGATLASYATQCSTALDDRCPGFLAIERAGAS